MEYDALSDQTEQSQSGSSTKIIYMGLISMFILFQIYFTITKFLSYKEILILDEAVVGLVIGIIVGAIVSSGQVENPLRFLQPEYIFLLLYPPILLASGYTFRKGEFAQGAKLALIYGALASLLNFLLVWALTELFNTLNGVREFNDFGTPVHLNEAYIVLFSAASTAIENEGHTEIAHEYKQKKLKNIMFGEAIVNDLLVMVLFTSYYNLSPVSPKSLGSDVSNTIPFLNFLLAVALLIGTAIASVLIGVAWGVLTTLYFKHLRFLTREVAVQAMTIFFFGFCAYVCSEYASVSGAVTMLVYSIFIGHYNFYNLSVSGQVTSGIFTDLLSLLSQCIIYLYVGTACWMFRGQGSDYTWSWTFFLFEVLIVPIARAICIGIVAFFAYWVSKKDADIIMKPWEVAVVALGGMTKGSLAFALMFSVQTPGKDQNEMTKSFQITQSTLLFICAFTTLVFGPASKYATKKILIKYAPAGQQDEKSKDDAPALAPAGTDGAVPEGQSQAPKDNWKKRFAQWFKALDESRIKPFLVYDYVQRQDELQRQKQAFKQNLQNEDARRDIITFVTSLQTTQQALDARASMTISDNAHPDEKSEDKLFSTSKDDTLLPGINAQFQYFEDDSLNKALLAEQKDWREGKNGAPASNLHYTDLFKNKEKFF